MSGGVTYQIASLLEKVISYHAYVPGTLLWRMYSVVSKIWTMSLTINNNIFCMSSPNYFAGLDELCPNNDIVNIQVWEYFRINTPLSWTNAWLLPLYPK